MGAMIDVLLDGVMKFAGEIIAVVLLIAALTYFRPLRYLFKKYKELTEGESVSSQNLDDEERRELERLRDERQMQELQRNADSGDARSQYMLGNKCYRDKNYTEAVKWYRKAAEQGHVYATHNLGNAYYNGRGVPQNYAEAFRLYRTAADKGYACAQYFLGNEYYYGKKLFTQDYTEAIRWYTKAAEQGHAKSQCSLGTMYQEGLGVKKDYVEAAKWYRKAADSDDEEAKKSATKKLCALQGRLRQIQEAMKQ